nr:hypothetical protein [Haloarcula salina]
MRRRVRSKRRGDERATRGQTTLDFAIGISVFLAVLIFIFLFVPGLLSPFTEGAQEETVVSNRVADGLTKSMLGSPERPYRLDRYCTVEFFDDQAAPASCAGSWSGGQPVESQVGLDPTRQHLNVTIYGNVSTAGSGSDRLCWDDTAEAIVEEGNASATCSVPFSRGETAPTNNDQSVTATRVVSLDHHDVTVSVEVW